MTPTPAEASAQAREKARQERYELLERIIALQGDLELENPISIAPFESKGPEAGEVMEAVRTVVGSHRAGDEKLIGLADLEETLEAFDAHSAELGFDERVTPVAVVSLDGLRRLESVLQELAQRRAG